MYTYGLTITNSKTFTIFTWFVQRTSFKLGLRYNCKVAFVM